MSAQLDKFLAAYSRESRENTLCLRKLLLEVFPKADESIEAKTGMITYSSPSERSTWVFAIAVNMKHISLIFSNGARIPDPANLLSGMGKEARHIKIKSEEEAQNRSLRQLLQEALKLAKRGNQDAA